MAGWVIIPVDPCLLPPGSCYHKVVIFLASLDKSRFLITDLQQDCGQNIKGWRGFSCALFCLVYIIAGLWMLANTAYLPLPLLWPPRSR
jgi:hypothetical protein